MGNCKFFTGEKQAFFIMILDNNSTFHSHALEQLICYVDILKRANDRKIVVA